ncbi:MAG: glutamate racemase [Halanaerobiaceae bacterium]
MRIAFFDSGMGGITVLKDALKFMPEENYLYYADTENVPYGTKERAEVREYIFKAVEFIFKKNIDVLIIACNTATSIAIKDLRAKYTIPIIGMEPAVKPAVERCGNKRVLVTATPLTLKEDKYENLVSRLKADNIVDSLALPELVEMAENFQFNKTFVRNYLLEKLSAYNLDLYSTIVLGCTHFIYYKNLFARILPKHIDIIDGNRGTINHLLRLLKLNAYRSIEDISFAKNSINIDFYISTKNGDLNYFYKYLDFYN